MGVGKLVSCYMKRYEEIRLESLNINNSNIRPPKANRITGTDSYGHTLSVCGSKARPKVFRKKKEREREQET